jgi:hypothetical protein
MRDKAQLVTTSAGEETFAVVTQTVAPPCLLDKKELYCSIGLEH